MFNGQPATKTDMFTNKWGKQKAVEHPVELGLIILFQFIVLGMIPVYANGRKFRELEASFDDPLEGLKQQRFLGLPGLFGHHGHRGSCFNMSLLYYIPIHVRVEFNIFLLYFS